MFKKIPHVEYERSSEKIDQDTRTKVVQALHREANAYGERRDSSMSFLVLGAIFLVIGFIFLMLSYKPYTVNGQSFRILRFDSLEFGISAAGLVIGGIGFLYGLVLAILFTRRIRVLRHDIDYINLNMRLDPGSTPLWIVDFWKKGTLRLKNYLMIKKIERENKAAAKGKSPDLKK